MKKPTIILFFLSLIAAMSLQAQVNVFHVDRGNPGATKKGVFYILPRTILKVDVVVKAEEKLKGPYSEYAEKYLGLEDVINFDFSNYSIEEVGISTSVEPDPAQIYYAEFGERDSKDLKKLKFQLNEAGFLISANNLATDKNESPGETNEVVVYETPGLTENIPGFYIDAKVKTKIDTIIRKVTVDTAMIEQEFYRSRMVGRTTEELALEALEMIEKIRESRYKLLTGFQETAYETGTIKYMDGELQKLEQEYLDLFRGKSYTDYFHYTYYVNPDGPGDREFNLFKFSTGSGIVKGRSSTGENVVLELTTTGIEDEAGSFAQPAAGNGIAYRVPGFAVAKVKIADQVFFEDRMQINQFGVVKRLPAQKFNVVFHPQTGGVRSVVME